MSNKTFIEFIETVQIDGHYFLMGQTYEVEGFLRKMYDGSCGKIKYCGVIQHYEIIIDDKKYYIPYFMAALVPALKPSELESRIKYWLRKAEGPEIKDYVKLAYQMHGVDISAKQGFDQADYAGRQYLDSIYGAVNRELPGQPKVVKVIKPDYEKLQSNIEDASVVARLDISLVSATMHRGDVIDYFITINKQPESDVEVSINSSSPDITVSPMLFVFTNANYDIAKSVVVQTRISEYLPEDKVVTITHSVNWQSEDIQADSISILLKKDR